MSIIHHSDSIIQTLEMKRSSQSPSPPSALFMFGCGNEIGVIRDIYGDIWFRGNDIAHSLGYEDPEITIEEDIDPKYKRYYRDIKPLIDASSDNDTVFVNETGMNLFVIRSTKPKAAIFVEWLCGHVLPFIRCKGQFKLKKPTDNPYKDLNEFLTREMYNLKNEHTNQTTQLFEIKKAKKS